MEANNDDAPKRIGPWLPTQAMARAAGSKHFFNGVPCKNGHVEPRHTSNFTCLECTRLRVDKWMKENPETAAIMKAKALVKAAIDYASDPEKYAQRMRRSRAIHIEKFRAREREYDIRNPDARRSRTRNRRARIRGNGGTHTASDILSILRSQKNKCAECNRKLNGDHHVDHVIPIALGGSNSPRNLQILCPTCNRSKGAKHPLDWARTKGRLL